MKASLLAVALLATIAISSAVDEECVQRKLRGLPVHWPNPADCFSFYRCTNKDVKRSLVCPAGKEYNPKTGRCANMGKNLCKLSLTAPLADITNPCADEVSGTFVAKEGSCRSFNICNDNMAYPQTCDAGSVFNTTIAACEPDTDISCWENLCLSKDTGAMVANPNDCYSFYVCNEQTAIAQACPTSSYFDKNDLNCQPGACPSEEDDKVCPSSNCLNKPDYTNFPAANTTTGFCTCLNNKPTYNECPADSVFDESVSICVAQDKVCPSSNCLNKPDYTNFPAANTTTGFCTCINNKPTYNECPADSVFDESVSICVAQDNVCPSSKCLNIPDCTNFPASNTTTGFCKCVNNEAIYQDCPADSIFDESTAVCVAPDTVCPSSNCLNKPDYTTFPASNTTSGYCTCLNNEASYTNCADSDFTYDTELGFCVKLPSDDCEEETPSPLLCEGGHSEGDFVPNTDNCMLFYICFEGELIESTCGTGNYYNDEEKACLPDTEGKCPDCTDAAHQATNERNKRSVDEVSCVEGDMTPHPTDSDKFYICDCDGQQILHECGEGNYFNPDSETCEAVDCTCPGGYTEGEMSPHPTDCDKFYICTNGVQEILSCGTDNYFNDVTLSCEKDVNNECLTKTDCTCAGGYIEGQLSPHPTDCDKFYICHGGSQVLTECGSDNYFNNLTLSCEKDVNNECFKKSDCTCPGGYTEGQMSAHPSECSKYYICSDSKQVLMDCGTNNYFNNDSCVLDTDFKCWPNACLNQTNGLVANPQQCNAFFLCKNQKPTADVCPEGYWFDASKSACEPDVDAVCYNPCANNDTINLLPHPDRTKYYFCNGPQTIVGTCHNGYFDPILGVCKIAVVVNPCDGKPENYAYADPEDNRQFYVCMSGVPTLHFCQPNTAFSNETGVCLPASDPDCDSTLCALGGFKSFPTLNDTEDNAFCWCRGNIAVKQYCAFDMVFNSDIGTCFSNAPCDPTVCENTAEYSVSPNRNDTQSFCLCVSETPVIVNCPLDTSFNPYTLLCTDVAISSQCDQYECFGQDDFHIFNSSVSTDNGFCMCRDQVATFRPCPEDTQFNGDICLLNNIDNPLERAADLCAADLCDTANGYTSFPASNTTNGFCLCTGMGSSPQYRDCPAGQDFNAAIGVCTAILEKCDNSMCVDRPEFSTVPAWNTTQGFCLCSGGIANFESCPPNNIFDSARGVCVLDIEGLCGDKTYCETCAAAKDCNSYPANNNANGFCFCSNANVPNFAECPLGHAFDVNQLVCLETPQSNCNVSLCADATVDSPISSPTLSGNSTFCYCSGPDDIMLLSCPAGKYYNDDLKLCINLIEESCSCPNGMINGDKVGDDTNCNKYFVCLDGVMHEESCAAGEYFDIANSVCCVDSKGVCASQAAFTCLGAYHEGELIEHPVNEQMYYVCKNSKLYERNCGVGRIFFKDMNQCIKTPRVNNRFPQKRSVDVDENEFLCSENEKRSVPSNCSQYEICIDQLWKRRTCTNFRYYNPEQQKCLEPRDDLVCMYAKVTNLSPCNNTNEFTLTPAKACQQYYRCQKEKWRLKSCGKQQYFNGQMGTCVAMPLNDGNLQCDAKETELVEVDKVVVGDNEGCQHLTVRSYERNCAMYLMCLDNDWWYQHCAVGMYFNRSLNYCIPDLDQQCPQTFKSKEVVVVEEFANETCLQDGSLRPSALACNRYFICIQTKWQMQHCNKEEFYDVSNAKCSFDLEGACLQLATDCWPQEKRVSPLNCANYEQCSEEGKWLQRECPLGQMYDDLLKDCVTNDGTCSRHGFKRVCKPTEIMAVTQNCSMFYYCSDYSWQMGNCLKGFMYSADLKKCIPHSLEDKCQPLVLDVSTHLEVYTPREADLCKGQLDGSSVAHPEDCTRFYICIQETQSQEMQCSKGSYFEASMGYCRPNDGACRLPLIGVCENASDGSAVAHPTDCQAYYKCSTINGTELMHCPDGQYFHKYIRQCRVDHGECKKEMGQKCIDLEHGTKLAHESYCNIYYACVKGLAIPVECPDNHQFNPILGTCVHDEEQQCQNGQLIDGNLTYSCGNLADGSYIPDRQDCTRYYICTNGQALHKKCSGSAYFDSQLLLCVPDDGSCPFVDEDVEQNNPVAPDPIVCEGKHGYLMLDPFNCNNFYACVHNKLKHERCYRNQFFNATWLQCQSKPATESNATELMVASGATRVQSQQCLDDIYSVDKICLELAEGSSIAEQDDCRRYITCQEAGEEPLPQRCRNGESYDSLLGFCRQNDGTCSLDNGQRVGECSGKHGQLARDVSNCRGYFVCINGQKIAQTCEDDEYFSKSQNVCQKDTLKMCGAAQQPEEVTKQSCTGLSESILYPYVYDNCRSYFQCFNGEAKIHKCADDLYFDPTTIKCVKGKTECLMPAQSLHRSPESAQTFTKLCSNKEFNTPYVNLENNCRSFYFCHNTGKVSHQLCPLGKKFDKDFNVCMPESLVICNK